MEDVSFLASCDRLGMRSFYHCAGDSLLSVRHFSDALKTASRDVFRIDPVAVLGVLMKNYILADRTMVVGVTRTPWMASPDGGGGWKAASLPRHDKRVLSAHDIAVELEERLLAEALEFLEGRRSVGILLSGGMDSRVVAAVVRRLQETGDFAGTVTALSWGTPDSRDVNYAATIARRFNWEFVHFPLTAELLLDNIALAGERGAEYSPVHLHAMQAVANVEGLDGILAGSYGDSVGRAEFSGHHLSDIRHILSTDLNRFSFLKKTIGKVAYDEIRRDLAAYRDRFPGRTERAYREIEMQAHYMRRQLNPCMEVIDDRIPLCQMFVHPNVFGFMWSLAPSCRTNEPYRLLLSRLPGRLLDIPWARNGRIYEGGPQQAADNLSSRNNLYGTWLRRDCRGEVLAALKSGALQSTGLFNERSLDMWTRQWPTDGPQRADRLDEKMAWLASLSLFIKQYGVAGPEDNLEGASFSDAVGRLGSLASYEAYRRAAALIKK